VFDIVKYKIKVMIAKENNLISSTLLKNNKSLIIRKDLDLNHIYISVKDPVLGINKELASLINGKFEFNSILNEDKNLLFQLFKQYPKLKRELKVIRRYNVMNIKWECFKRRLNIQLHKIF